MKSINFLFVVLFTVILQSCQNTGSSFRVGFIVHTLADERWAIERDVFTKRINELGGSVLFENANQDERVQYHQAEQMIESGVDVLVVVPVNSKTSASIARLCKKKRVKLISYDIMIDNSEPDLFISFDNIKIGELMASYAIEKQPTGNYILLWGDGGMNVAQWVKEGQMNVLNKYIEDKKINIVYKAFIENWSSDGAVHLTDKIFDNTSCCVDAIIASSDGIADGVIQSVKNKKLEKYPLITGQDASQKALQYIRDGMQGMTIYKSFDKMAVIAANSAFEMAKGRKVKADTVLFNGRVNVPSILLEPFVVDKSNIDQIVK